MSTIDELLRKHRKRIIDREAATFRELLSVYRELQRDLKLQFQDIQKMITDARNAGEEISPSWFRRSRRLQDMLSQVQEQIVRFGGRVTNVVSREQTAAISIATEHTRDAVKAIVGGNPIEVGSLLPTRAIEHAVGMMGDGSPMITYFAKTFAPNVADVLGKEILKAVALGTDFNTVARRLMAAGDITRQRALTMARTEVNRVRRATTQRIYQEHADVFTGWEWVAAKSERTCVVCLALDGTIYELDVPFPQHINCRCTLIPVIKGVERPKRELGSEWFDRQSDEVKEKMIGIDGLDAYSRGDVKLIDFVGYATSKEFGKRVYTLSLIKALAGQK